MRQPYLAKMVRKRYVVPAVAANCGSSAAPSLGRARIPAHSAIATPRSTC
jgi:hypothetical protein